MGGINMKDYEKTYREFKLECPEYYNWMRDQFDKLAEETPDKTAFWWVDDLGNEKKFTFSELAEETKRFANVLKENGVNRGDVFAVVLSRDWQYWVAFLGCLRAGVVVTPGTAMLSESDFEYRFNRSETVGVLTNAENAAKIDNIKHRCETLKTFMVIDEKRQGWVHYDEAMAGASSAFEAANTKAEENSIIYFTSGTVGYPKMTLHSHVSYPLGHTITGKFWLDLTPDDVHFNIGDTGWAKAGWSSMFGPWNCGATVFAHKPGGGKFGPERNLHLLEEYPITTMCGPPTIFRVFVQEDLSQFNFKHLRHCVAAGEPLNPEVIEEWKKHTGITIRDGYGQTETCLLVGTFPCLEVKKGSMGRPAPGYHVDVIDEDANPLGINQEGDIAVKVSPERPVGLFKEYWKDEEKTNASFRGDWYLTGDRAMKDEDGYFWFMGRSDDIIITSGYRIGPFEVESALVEHPAVAESAVVASPHETRGEVVKAFVILSRGYEGSEELAKEIQEFVKKNTAAYKYPREIEFVKELPKTISGKIRRVELRKKEREKKGKG